MIEITPSTSRAQANYGWLSSKFGFSFGDYYDPNNTHFGALRVFNDDTIQPGTGFDMHPHREMEIVTIMVSGTARHSDIFSEGEHLIHAGEIQVISAGTGVFHSNFNDSLSDPLRLLQIWLSPREQGLKPALAQKMFSYEQKLNQLLPVVSGNHLENTLHIHQDTTFYLSILQPGYSVHHTVHADRKAYLFVISGSIHLNDNLTMVEGDSAKISDTSELDIQAVEESQVLIINLY